MYFLTKRDNSKFTHGWHWHSESKVDLRENLSLPFCLEQEKSFFKSTVFLISKISALVFSFSCAISIIYILFVLFFFVGNYIFGITYHLCRMFLFCWNCIKEAKKLKFLRNFNKYIDIVININITLKEKNYVKNKLEHHFQNEFLNGLF